MSPATPARVELDYTGSERLTMNMGPQHPSAHGVFRAVLTLEGETGKRMMSAPKKQPARKLSGTRTARR